jgi:hypothetical protein
LSRVQWGLQQQQLIEESLPWWQKSYSWGSPWIQQWTGLSSWSAGEQGHDRLGARPMFMIVWKAESTKGQTIG